MKKAFAILLTLLVLGSGLAFAQNKTSLNIQCTEAGAEVYINGRLAGKTTPNFSFLVPQGNVQVRVQKNGFRTFETVLKAGTRPINLMVRMERIGSSAPPTPAPPAPAPVVQHNLQISSNVIGAEVIINNVSAGRTPFNASVAPGSYTVTVRAPGYADFNQAVVVRGHTAVNATLQPMLYPLSLGNLRPGAEIFLNGSKVGTASSSNFSVQVAPGTYTVTIRLGGFLDFTSQVTVGSSPQTVSPVFQPMPAAYSFNIPASMANPEARGNPWSQMRLYIDGVPQKDFRGNVEPGRRTLRLVSGAFQMETVFDFEAGRTYTIEPFFGLNIR